MFLGNHQQMSGRLGVNIANNYRRLVLVDQFGWNLLCHDSAKQATWF
jgi:hypothetical protein